ncbi:MAG TPA: peptide ABC transporter substrate-binding protein [Methylomirabilota bacterium]|nr:peptide ABC transporter substrate-binding protein [Methylomirabilota bacterium]
MLSRRQFLAASATGAALAAARVRPAAAQAPTKGGQIIVGLSQEPQNFNPLMPTIEAQRGVHMAIFDDLWRIDPRGAFVPNLAAAIPTQTNGGISKDGTSFTVKLRPGVTWHDGQPFTARDVVFTWKTLMNPRVTAFSTVGFDQIADMWTADETTLKFKLKEPYAPILDVLADLFIVPEHVLARSADVNKDEFNTRRPVGTGPFKFVEWTSGDHITLEAHRAYHGPGPYLDRLIFKYVPDLTVLFTQLKTGEVDMTGIQGIPVDLYPEAKTLSTINLYVDPSTTYETIAPNHLLPMFKDKRMRQALYLGMDKKPIVEKIYLGLAPESETYVPPQSWAYNPKVKGHHKYDPERAKKLLEEIGWKVGADGIRVKDGQRLSFENACTAGNKQREQIQQLLQQQWRQIGVEMKINNKPAAVLFGDFYRMSKFETIIIGMAMGSDPEHSFRLHSKYIPAKGGLGRNSIAYENPEVDRLLEAGVRDIDRAKRKKAYFRLQEVLADEVPYLPIYHFVNIRGTRKGVEGFKPNSNMQEYSWNTNEWWIRKA